MKKKIKEKAKNNFAKKSLKYIIPFLIFFAATFLVNLGVNEYLAYSIKVVLGIALLIYFWKQYKEIKIKFDILAWLAGFAIIIVWLALDFAFKGWGSDSYNPNIFPGLSYWLILVKLLGLLLFAPVFEELFIRSFLARIFIDKDFEKVKIGTFAWMSFIFTAVIFGLLHGSTLFGSRLVPGLATGILFNIWLYYRKDIFSCIQCHAAANLGLALYVIFMQNWALW
jgi:CAAX prenyl protease-like protein